MCACEYVCHLRDFGQSVVYVCMYPCVYVCITCKEENCVRTKKYVLVTDVNSMYVRMYACMYVQKARRGAYLLVYIPLLLWIYARLWQ